MSETWRLLEKKVPLGLNTIYLRPHVLSSYQLICLFLVCILGCAFVLLNDGQLISPVGISVRHPLDVVLGLWVFLSVTLWTWSLAKMFIVNYTGIGFFMHTPHHGLVFRECLLISIWNPL